MNAHEQLERQLRASVTQAAARGSAHRAHRQSRSRGVSALMIAATTAVALGVVVVALVALHRGRAPSPRQVTPATTSQRARVGPRPRDPGPIPRNVDDAAVAAAWNTAWREDPSCGPGARMARGSGVSYGTPSATMLSTLPVLSSPATSADRLPTRLDTGGRPLPWLQGGRIYVRYVRRVRVAYGRTFWLVPAAGLGRPPLPPAAANHCYQLTVAALRAELPTVPPAKRAATRRYGDAEFALGRYNLETSKVYEGVFLFDESPPARFCRTLRGRKLCGSEGGGGGGDVQSLESIQQGGPLGGGGGGNPPIPTVMDGIVPAGVASVTLQFPATHHGSRRLPALNATGDVVNNVFVIPVPTLFQRGGWPSAAIWRASSGKVIKTINETPFHP